MTASQKERRTAPVLATVHAASAPLSRTHVRTHADASYTDTVTQKEGGEEELVREAAGGGGVRRLKIVGGRCGC